MMVFTIAACSGEDETDAPNGDNGIVDDNDDDVNGQWELDEDLTVIASVNGEEIKTDEWRQNVDQMKMQYTQMGVDFSSQEGQMMLNQIKSQALESLIQRALILQEAIEQGYEASDEAVEEDIQGVIDQYESEEDFEAALEHFDFTRESFAEMLKGDLTLDAFINEAIEIDEVTEEDLEETYAMYVEQAEAAGEAVEDFEDIKDDLEAEVENQYRQEALNEIIEALKEEGDIERFV